MARTKEALADSFIKLNEKAQKAGLVINVNKTKYIKFSRNQVKEQIVDLGGIEIGNVVVKALCYKPEGCGDRVPMKWIFSNLPNPSSRTMALGSTQPLTEMSTGNLKKETWG
jgi:hypothetical protein